MKLARYAEIAIAVACAAIIAMAVPNPARAAMVIDFTVQGRVAEFAGGLVRIISAPIVEVSRTGLGESRGILAFDISHLAAPVQSATLNLLSQGSTLASPTPLNLFGYVGDGILTFDDYQPLGDAITSFAYFNEASVDIDVTNFINSLIPLNSGLAGIQIVWGGDPRPPIPPEIVTFGSMTSGEFASTLTVTAVPLPAAGPLLVIALFGLGIAGWFRRRGWAA